MKTERKLKGSGGQFQLRPIVLRVEPARIWTAVLNRSRGPRGQEILEFRLDFGIRRAELARMMKVSPVSLVLWESGRNEPKEMAWAAFQRAKRNYREKVRNRGDDLNTPGTKRERSAAKKKEKP